MFIVTAAMPQPISWSPSRIEPGSHVRPDQPKRSAARRRHSVNGREENGRPVIGSTAGSLRSRSSTGSMPSE